MTEASFRVLLLLADAEERHVLPRFAHRQAEVQTVATITEACDAIHDQCPELLIVDTDLPDGDCKKVLRQLREAMPWAQSIVICRPDRHIETAELIAAGANDVIFKPFDVGTLEPRIARLKRAFHQAKTEYTLKKDLEDRLRHLDRVMVLGTMMSTVAHEIANPLSVIIANSTMSEELLDRPAELGPNEYEMLLQSAQETHTAARTVVDFVTRIRDFSRRDQEDPVTTRLSITVETALLFLRPKLSATSVRVHVPPRSEAPIVSHVPSRITQAITNAVGNAIEALEGKGNVWIRYTTDAAEVSICIDDDGPGMSEEILRQARKPFFTTKKTGTGLGMSVMHSVMRVHRGRVEIERSVHGGLSVRLVLPVRAEEES